MATNIKATHDKGILTVSVAVPPEAVSNQKQISVQPSS